MAVTIQQVPQIYTPSDNPIMWRFSSNQTGQANFSFLVEVYIDAVLDSRHIVFPEVGIYAHFDASERLKASVQASSLSNTLVQDAANWKSCYIKITERYGTPPTNQANATSSTVYAFKSSLSDEDFVNFDHRNYLVNYTTFGFMTNFDRNSLVLGTNTDFYLQVINNLLTPDLVIEYYDVDNVLLGDTTTAISNTIRILQINLKDTLHTIPSGTAYMNITLQGATISEVIRLNILQSDACNVLTPCIWLNEFGGFEQYIFTHNYISRSEIQSYSYERQFGKWNGSTFEYNVFNSGVTNYLKVIKDSGEIVSDWINEDLQGSVVRMYESPYVVVQIGATSYYQIIVVNSSYEIKQGRFEELFNEIVQYEKSNMRKSINL